MSDDLRVEVFDAIRAVLIHSDAVGLTGLTADAVLAVVQPELDRWARLQRNTERERDEGLTERDRALAEVARLRAVVERVEALHKKGRAQRRIPGALILPPPEDICLGCSVIADEEDEDDGYATARSVIQSRPWPCPTTAALRTPDGGSDG